MLSPMWPHFVSFFHTVNHWFFGSLGTTPLGWFAENVVLFFLTVLVTLIVTLCLRGKEATTRHFKENVVIGVVSYVVIMLSLWGYLYFRSVYHSAYEDHEYFVEKVKNIRSGDQENLSGTSGGLKKQIEYFQRKNYALQAELEKRKHSMVAGDPAFQNTLSLLRAAQSYREGRKGQTCVTYITAPPKSYEFAFAIQQIIGPGNCAPFGPMPFDLHSGTEEEKLAMQDVQDMFIVCHVTKGDTVGEKFCSDLGNDLLVKISYAPLPNPEKHYRLDRGAGTEKIVWLQFGTDAQWKGEYYAKKKR